MSALVRGNLGLIPLGILVHRFLLQTVGLTIGLTVCLSGGLSIVSRATAAEPGKAPADGAAKRSPNIVFIMADDK